jgi:hypothetical protein
MMDVQFVLSILAATVLLLLLGIGATNVGIDSRPGFLDDQGHHN